jgi:hypothetical protein
MLRKFVLHYNKGNSEAMMYILLILILSAANLQSAESGKKRVRGGHQLSLIRRRMLNEATGHLELPEETDSDSEAEHMIFPADFLPICPSSHKDHAVKAPQVSLSLIMRDSFGADGLEHLHTPAELHKISKWHNSNLMTLVPSYYDPLVHNRYPVSERKNKIAAALSDLTLEGNVAQAKDKANEIFAKNPKAISYRFEWSKTLKNGQTIKKSTNPLIEAVRCGNFEFAKFLINKGVPPCYSAENTRTPLHIAASKADVNLVKLLTDKEAKLCLDYTLKADGGETPLDIAERKRQKYLHDFAVTARYDAIIAMLQKAWAEQQAEEAFYAGDTSASEESEEDN